MSILLQGLSHLVMQLTYFFISYFYRFFTTLPDFLTFEVEKLADKFCEMRQRAALNSFCKCYYNPIIRRQNCGTGNGDESGQLRLCEGKTQVDGFHNHLSSEKICGLIQAKLMGKKSSKLSATHRDFFDDQ